MHLSRQIHKTCVCLWKKQKRWKTYGASTGIRSAPGTGGWRRMLFVWPSMDISSFLCVQPFPDPSSTSSLLSLHYLITFCFYCRSTFSLSITPSPYLPTHFFHIMLFVFLSLSSFFHAFTPSVFLYFTTLSFFCYSCAVSLPLSLSQKISSPHLHLWVFVLGVEFSSSLCVFSLGCTYRYSVQFGSYKLNMLWISEPARNRHRKRKSIIS